MLILKLIYLFLLYNLKYKFIISKKSLQQQFFYIILERLFGLRDKYFFCDIYS